MRDSKEKINILEMIGMFLLQNASKISFVLMLCTIPVRMVYANDAEAAWDGVMEFLMPWVGRLGGGMIFIGAIDFGMGFKNDDAEGKTRGLRTMIAGAIVVAVGASSEIFLYTPGGAAE